MAVPRTLLFAQVPCLLALSLAPSLDARESRIPVPAARVAAIAAAAETTLELLTEIPYLLPVEPSPELRLGLIGVHYGPRDAVAIETDQVLPLLDSLALDRARQSERTTKAKHWLLVLDAEARDVMYWTPIDDPRVVRSETHGGHGEIRPASGQLDTGTAWVRVPFVPGGHVALFKAGKTRPALLDARQLSGSRR